MPLQSTSRRTRRRTAAAMALVWLFALFAGVANACALQETGTHGHTEAAAVVAGSAVVTAGHLGLIATHDVDEDSQAQPSCLKACDEQARGLYATAADPIDPGDAPFIARAWDGQYLLFSSPSRAGDQRKPLPPQPPPRLLFSTLLL